VSFFYWVPVVTSLFTLLSAGVDRLLAISRPLFYRTHVTPERIKMLLGSLWGYSFFSGAWLFVYTGFKVTPEEMVATFTTIDFLPDEINNYAMMPHMFIAVIGNAIAYWLTYRQLRRAGRAVHGHQCSRNKQTSFKRNKRFLRMAVVTIGVQLFLWLPYSLMYIFAPINRPDTPKFLTDYLQPFVYTVTISTSWVNALVYYGLNKDYRAAYHNALRRLMKRSSIHPEDTTVSVITTTPRNGPLAGKTN
jgi:hypothetical protein